MKTELLLDHEATKFLRKYINIHLMDFMTSVWYKRTISIPSNWEEKRILLHFGASDYKTAVWINGKKVGEHEGGYTPFSFDITYYLKPKEDILI